MEWDWKKPTFYHFAASYINSISLAADLFKIYETRVWMSTVTRVFFTSSTPNLQAFVRYRTRHRRIEMIKTMSMVLGSS